MSGGVAVVRVGAATEPELKQKKQMFEDSLNSTKAALEEGIVPGSGTALLKAAKVIASLKLLGDEALGAALVAKACEMPARQIAINTGMDGSVMIAELNASGDNMGFNAISEKIENLLDCGVKNTLTYAASVAGIVLISEALIGDAEEKEESSKA